ncbi:MAG: PAS domain S-box protein [Deltaproteobacteria bacterium]|nr:PAS domain S-box protein [Deltaproteobacteria bacterium]
MKENKVLNVVIVGGGSGCKAIMDMIFAEKLSQLRMKLIGVACSNPDAVGYKYAQEKRIYTTTDYRELYKLSGLNMIIELTGKQGVVNEIFKTKPDHVRLMGNVAARLFWDVFQIEEKRMGERNQAETQLRESEQRLRSILDSIETGVLLIDPETHTIVEANPLATGLIGLPRKKVLGQVCHKFICPAGEGKCPITDLGQKMDNSENVLLTASGDSVPILKTVVPLMLGGKVHLLESFLDITERKKAENELRESQERYYTVLEASPDPIVVYDMKGRGTYVNPAFTQVFGWTPGEILGMKIRYTPEENWPETKMMIDKVLAGESFSGIESRRYTKGGNVLDVSISVAVYLNRDGAPVGSIHILRDITDRKLVDEALQKAHDKLERRVEERTAKLAETAEQLTVELAERKHTEKALRFAHKDLAVKAAALESANEELSQYAYVVSHDLKAPLRAIHNYSDFLREDLEGSLGPEQTTYLDGLNRAIRQGEELVSDLLEFSRVGKRPGPVNAVDMGVFFRELMGTFDLPADVKVVVADDLPTIEADQTLLRQIFRNLIVNAAKFNNSTNKRVELGWAAAAEDCCEFFVRDNGIGIDSQYYEQIFRVFQRLHTRQEYEGTGLGLAIVKKASSKLYGSIRIESILGKGSTFFITLPKQQKEK